MAPEYNKVNHIRNPFYETVSQGPFQDLHSLPMKRTWFKLKTIGDIAISSVHISLFIFISESRAEDRLKFKNYYLLDHHARTACRLFIPFRNNVPAARVAVPAYESKNCICARTIIGAQRLTLIAAFIEPGEAFDA